MHVWGHIIMSACDKSLSLQGQFQKSNPCLLSCHLSTEHVMFVSEVVLSNIPPSILYFETSSQVNN